MSATRADLFAMFPQKVFSVNVNSIGLPYIQSMKERLKCPVSTAGAGHLHPNIFKDYVVKNDTHTRRKFLAENC